MEQYKIETSGQHKLKLSGNYQIKIADNIDVEILEHLDDSATLTMEIGKNSKVNYLVLENLEKDIKIDREINVEENSFLDFKIIILNKMITEEKIDINLNGKYSKANYKLVTVAGENVKNDIKIKLSNNAPFTEADIWQKGVIFGGGITNFQASGHIARGSEKAKSFQESKILLLDDASRGEASPLLLIDHYDVLAGHKATVSRVEDEAMYYLNTRGISKENAEKLMIKAFIAPLIDNIENEEFKMTIENKIKSLLNYE